MFRRSSFQAAVLSSTALLALSGVGCATTGSTTAAPAPSSSGYAEANTAYIQRVERMAMQRGIVVKWVNPPMKRRLPRSN